MIGLVCVETVNITSVIIITPNEIYQCQVDFYNELTLFCHINGPVTM